MRQIALILSLLSFNVWADRAAPIFELGGGYWCKNYGGQLLIVGKIASKQYEVYFPDPMTGKEEGHMVLETHKSDFTSNGVVPDDLWVKANPDHFPSITIKQNGFDKKYDLIEESAECETKAAYVDNHPSKEELAAEKKADEEQKKSIEDYKADTANYRERKKERAAFAKLSKTEQKKIRDEQDKEREVRLKEWYSKSIGEREKICQSKGIAMDSEQTYCR